MESNQGEKARNLATKPTSFHKHKKKRQKKGARQRDNGRAKLFQSKQHQVDQQSSQKHQQQRDRTPTSLF